MNAKIETKRKWFQNPYIKGVTTVAAITAVAVLGLRSCGQKPVPCEPCQKPVYSSCYKPGEDPTKVKKELRCFNPKLESRMELAPVTLSPDLPQGFKPCKEGEIVVCVDVTPRPPAPHVEKKVAKKAEKQGCCNPKNKCKSPQVCNKECKCETKIKIPSVSCNDGVETSLQDAKPKVKELPIYLNNELIPYRGDVGSEILIATVAVCPVNGPDGNRSHSIARIISLKGDLDKSVRDTLMGKLNATLVPLKLNDDDQARKFKLSLKVQ